MKTIVGLIALFLIMSICFASGQARTEKEAVSVWTSSDHNHQPTGAEIGAPFQNDTGDACKNLFNFLKAALFIPVPYDIRPKRLMRQKATGVCTKLGSTGQRKILQIG